MIALDVNGGVGVSVDELVSAPTAVFGITGSGKSNTLARIVEGLRAASVQTVVIDPKGEAWWLRASRTGAKGLDMLVVGDPNGDVPIQSIPTGAALADVVLAQPISVAIQTPMRNGGPQFVGEFLDRLLRARLADHSQRKPIVLVIDEARQFAPQSGGDSSALNAVRRIATMGRSVGLSLVMATQRAASIDKEVVSQARRLIVHQTRAAQDRSAIADWVQVKVSETAELAKLRPGHAIYWDADGQRHPVTVPIRETYDGSARVAVDAATTATPIDRALIESLRAALAPPPEPVTDEQGRVVQGVGEAEVERRIKAAIIERDDFWRGWVATARERIEEALHINGSVPPVEAAMTPPSESTPRPRRDPRVAPPAIKGGGDKRMLIALAQHREGLTRRKLAMLATMSPRSGTFSTYISRLRTNGWATDEGNQLVITDAGVEALGEYEPLPTGKALLAHWRSMLPGGASRMFDALVSAGTKGLTRSNLATEANMSQQSGTFSTYLSKLRTLELVDERGDTIKLCDELRGR